MVLMSLLRDNLVVSMMTQCNQIGSVSLLVLQTDSEVGGQGGQAGWGPY